MGDQAPGAFPLRPSAPERQGHRGPQSLSSPSPLPHSPHLGPPLSTLRALSPGHPLSGPSRRQSVPGVEISPIWLGEQQVHLHEWCQHLKIWISSCSWSGVGYVRINSNHCYKGLLCPDPQEPPCPCSWQLLRQDQGSDHLSEPQFP